MLRRNFARAMVLAATVLVLGLSGPPALAQSLDQLRASGAVGERYDGYAEAPPGPKFLQENGSWVTK